MQTWKASFLGGHLRALVYSLVDIHCSEKGPYFRDLFDFLGPYWVPICSVLAEFTQKNSIQFNSMMKKKMKKGRKK